MKVQEFLQIMQKVVKFKEKLNKEGITGQIQEIILKAYIEDITQKINTTLLKKVV